MYSRVVGYFRPTREWNKGKAKEFVARKVYKYKTGLRPVDKHDTLQRQVAGITGLSVAGYIKSTLSDYPGKTQASIMFTYRCNLACPWCHNGPVVEGERGDVTLVDVFRHVTSTCHKYLVVSGGKPTIQKGLVPFLRLIKQAGVCIKLNSTGTLPKILEQILTEKLIDFIAMDIKCALENYGSHWKKVKARVLEESIMIIKNSGIPYEFRTTAVPELVDVEDLLEAKQLAERI